MPPLVPQCPILCNPPHRSQGCSAAGLQFWGPRHDTMPMFFPLANLDAETLSPNVTMWR